MTVKRLPVRGACAGLLLGLGVALILMMFGVIAFTVMWLVVITLVGLVAGVVFAYLTPARHRPPSPSTDI